jgi:CspA family cold shock protein
MVKTQGQRFNGVCKFWNAIKGHGFLIDDDGGPDLFVSQHDIVTGDSGFRALVAGQRVECIYDIADNGKPIAKTVTGPNGAALKSFKDMYTAKRKIEQKKPPDPNKLYGSVKWFNEEKSFGFIIPQKGGDDLFFHFSECLKGVKPAEGDQVEYAVKKDKSGKTVGTAVKNKTQKVSKARTPGASPVQPPAFAAPAGYGVPVYGVPAAYGTPGRKAGTVKFFDEAKGYGFIIPDLGGKDIHVHKSNVMGGALNKDDRVEYEEQTIGGKFQAAFVSVKKAAAQDSSKKPRVK